MSIFPITFGCGFIPAWVACVSFHHHEDAFADEGFKVNKGSVAIFFLSDFCVFESAKCEIVVRKADSSCVIGRPAEFESKLKGIIYQI